MSSGFFKKPKKFFAAKNTLQEYLLQGIEKRSVDTLIVMGLGLLAFSFDTFFGIFFVKFINLFSKKKINPMVGAAGISAFPMASRIVHQLGVKEDKSNYLLMHAASANIAGQVASAIAGGVILSLFL